MTKRILSAVVDLAGFAGMALVAYGAWLIHEPAGFIVGGILLFGGAAFVARSLKA